MSITDAPDTPDRRARVEATLAGASPTVLQACRVTWGPGADSGNLATHPDREDHACQINNADHFGPCSCACGAICRTVSLGHAAGAGLRAPLPAELEALDPVDPTPVGFREVAAAADALAKVHDAKAAMARLFAAEARLAAARIDAGCTDG